KARHAQHFRRIAERAVLLEPVLLRDAAVAQRDQAVLHDFQRDLVLNLLHAEAGSSLVLDNEAFDLVVGDISRPDDRDVAPRGVADPLLLAVDDPGIAITLCGGRKSTARTGADKRLSQSETTDLFHTRHRRQPLALLFF